MTTPQPGTTGGIRTYTATNPCGKPFTAGLGSQLCIINQDLNNDIQVGYTTLDYGDGTGVDIAAGNSFNMPDTKPMYAVSPPGTSVQFQVVPGGQFTESAVQIATQLLPLAVDIAEQIAETGISLLGAPQLLYQTPQPQPGANLVGCTTTDTDYNTTDTWLQAAQKYDSYTGRPMAETLQKWFMTAGVYPTSIPARISQLQAVGCKFYVVFHPSTIQSAAERVKLANLIALFQQSGVIFDCCLTDEPNTAGPFNAPADFASYINYYAPVVCNPAAYWTSGGTAPVPVKLILNFGGSGWYNSDGSFKPQAGPLWWPGPSGTGWAASGAAVDFYSTMYVRTTGALVGPADYLGPLEALADASGLPFGIGEFGNAASNLGENNPSFSIYTDYIVTKFGSRLSAGKQNYYIIYFNPLNGQNSFNTVLSSADPKVPGIDDIYDNLAGGATNVTLAGGASVVLKPISPSPVAGYAFCNSLSYDLALGQLVAAAASTNPFVSVQLDWYDTDDPDAIPIATQQWFTPIGSAGTSGTITVGTGPQVGQYVKLTITNHDTVACSFGFTMNSNSRTVSKHDFYWDASSSVALFGFATAGGASYANSLGTVSASLAANGGTTSRVLSLFAGEVYVSFNQTGAPNAAQIQIELTPLPANSWRDGAPILNAFANQFPLPSTLLFPRCPVLATFTNNNTTGSAVPITAEFIAKR